MMMAAMVGATAVALSARNTKEAAKAASSTSAQGLTLVHFLAQHKRFLWDRECIEGLCWWCLGGSWGV